MMGLCFQSLMWGFTAGTLATAGALLLYLEATDPGGPGVI